MATVRPIPSMTSRKLWQRNTILALLGVIFLGVLIDFPSTDSPVTSSSDKCAVPNAWDVSTCNKMDFPRRTQEEDDTYRAAWRQTMESVKARGLTFVDKPGLIFHRDLLSEIEANGIPGMIFECGVAKAGSAITIASYKHPERCLHLFDTFEGIPEPSSKDGPDVKQRYKDIQTDKLNCKKGLASCHKEYYGNMDDLLSYDKEQFNIAGYPCFKNSVFFHKGLFDDTVWPGGPVAYAHLDGDWYDSTYHMLERISPHMSDGGYLVLDDVYEWSGAKNAFIDFFQVDLEWLQSLNSEKHCWTTVTEKTGTKRYFRVALTVRAIAQVYSSMSDLLKDRDLQPCVTPSTSDTATSQ